MRFCPECGTEGTPFGITKYSSTGNIQRTPLERFAHSVSDFIVEDDRPKPEEDESYTSKETRQDLYNLLLNKHFLLVVILILVLLIVGVFYLISDNQINVKKGFSINQLPVLRYNPSTNKAILIVKDQGFIRQNEEFGEYVDFIVALDKGYDIPDKKELGMIFEEVPYFVDLLIKDDMPNYEEQPYDVEIRTPLSVKKEVDKDYWVSDEFKLHPPSKAKFVISFGSDEEFPYGAMNTIFFVPTKEI